MALSLKHTFQSPKGDGTDATLVRPSNWNAEHTVTMATSKILGRSTAGVGAVEELATTPYMIGLLNTVDYAALAVLLGLPTTGDAKLTFKAVADAGWILANDGTIGDVGSGATITAGTLALFTLFYSAPFTDTICPLQTTAGGATTRAANGTAANAFTTNKCRMVIPKILGRALIIAGSGAGLSSRLLGETGGSENVTLTTAQIPKHTHTGTNWSGSTTTASGSGTSAVSNTTITGVPGLGTLATSDPGNHQHNVFLRDTGHGHTLNNATNVYTSNVGGNLAGGAGPGVQDISVNSNTTGITIGSVSGAGANDNKVSLAGAHTHTFTGALTAGTLTFNGAGTCTLTTISVTLNNIGGTTDVMSVGDGAHTNMQPWTAWNVMIRL